MKLTKKQKQDYIKSGYNKCPNCSSKNISSCYANKDDNWVECVVECEDCFEVWMDIYTLTDMRVD